MVLTALGDTPLAGLACCKVLLPYSGSKGIIPLNHRNIPLYHTLIFLSMGLKNNKLRKQENKYFFYLILNKIL